MEQKKYWKNGFYDEPIEGGVELTEEYWMQLLEAQSNGMEITEDEKGYPIATKHQMTIGEARNISLLGLYDFDESHDVNSFFLQGDEVWLNKELRLSIRNAVEIKKSKGIEYTSIWYGTKEYVLPVQFVLDMLDDLEIYADACNSVTRRHQANILILENIENIEKYNYKTGYPEKLKFTYYEKSIL